MMLYRLPEEEPEEPSWRKILSRDRELYIVMGVAIGCILLATIFG
jgi:hypothetical protein